MAVDFFCGLVIQRFLMDTFDWSLCDYCPWAPYPLKLQYFITVYFAQCQFSAIVRVVLNTYFLLPPSGIPRYCSVNNTPTCHYEHLSLICFHWVYPCVIMLKYHYCNTYYYLVCCENCIIITSMIIDCRSMQRNIKSFPRRAFVFTETSSVRLPVVKL